MAGMLAIGFLAATAQATAAPSGECASTPPPGATGATTTAYSDLLRAVPLSPFYSELVRLHGAPLRCAAQASESDLTITYSFAHGARLVVHTTPSIEFAEHRIEMRAISQAKALELLEAQERADYGESMCGIAWKAPPEAVTATDGSRGVAYHGDTCNCQARILRGRKGVTLLLRSAC
jgi:hypothetical protein